MSDKSLTLSARQTADFELLANGGFAPLKGFHGLRGLEVQSSRT